MFRRGRSPGSGSGSRVDVLTFTCAPGDKGVIAEPVPARAALPAWFRKLPGTDADQLSATNDGLTVKRCMPFLDAMTTGWIVPLAATVRLEVGDDGKSVVAGWEHDREMVSNHAAFQVAGNPFEPRPPMKFHNFWTIATPPGWSSLIVPAINRPNDVVHVFAGVVDTDTYRSPINFPFVATAPDGVHTIPQGTPLVQVIPFRRADAGLRGTMRVETEAEATESTRIRRSTGASDGWYRRRARAAGAPPTVRERRDARGSLGLVNRAAVVRTYRWVGAALIVSAAVHTVTSKWDSPTFELANFFSYFTVVSNLYAAVVLVVGGWLAVPERPLSHRFEMWRGAAVLYMGMTGVVYAVLLSGVDVQTDAYTNWVMHRIMPLVVVADWVYRHPRVHLDLRSTLVWLVLPLLYLPYTLIRGAIVDWYPYPFVDPTRDGGYVRVALMSVVVALGFVAATWLITWGANQLVARSNQLVVPSNQ